MTRDEHGYCWFKYFFVSFDENASHARTACSLFDDPHELAKAAIDHRMTVSGDEIKANRYHEIAIMAEGFQRIYQVSFRYEMEVSVHSSRSFQAMKGGAQ